MDEDPYFLPDFTKTNPEKKRKKKEAYDKNIEIIDSIDDNLGRTIIISPDFDKFLDIGGSKKPTKAYEKFKELKEANSEKFQKIISLFKQLTNPSQLNYKAVNLDGEEWRPKEESEMEFKKPQYSNLKELIKSSLNTYSSLIQDLDEREKEDLIKIIETKLGINKNSGNQDIERGPMNNWI